MRDLSKLATDVYPITDEVLEINASNCFVLSFSWSISPFSPAYKFEVGSNGCSHLAGIELSHDFDYR